MIFFIVAITTLFAKIAVLLAVLGGVSGILSIYILNKRLNEFDVLTSKQKNAVDRLDARVQRIEGAIKHKEN